MSVGDVSRTEGNNFIFTVTLTGARGGPVTVEYTVNSWVAATPGTDFIPSSGRLIFGPDETSKTITVPVPQDNEYEGTESFVVYLFNASADVTRPLGFGTIVDDDPLPTLSIEDVSVSEGNGGVTNAVLTIRLSNPSRIGVLARASTVDGTATAADSDYVPLSRVQVQVRPGETTATLTVLVYGDTKVEPHEAFSVVVESVQGSTVADGTAQVTIQNDDGGQCSPRPPVRVEVTRRTPDQLQVTITATGTPGNVLRSLRFIKLTNASINELGAVQLNQPVAVAPNTQSVTYTVQRPTRGVPTTVELVVTDACGDWPTFFGAGAAE